MEHVFFFPMLILKQNKARPKQAKNKLKDNDKITCH